MKLRLRHNSVRLRLTQGEVAQLRDTGVVEEYIEFAEAQRFTYRIRSGVEFSALACEYRGGDLSLSVPRTMVIAWADSPQVGMVADGPLRIAIEKDFRCLDTSHPEENADTFPNPLEGKAC